MSIPQPCWLILAFPFVLSDVRRRDRGIVLEEHERLFLGDVPEERFLGGQRVHGIEVVAHDPGQAEMRRRRHKLGREDRRLAAAFDVDHLMVHAVSARALHAHAGHDRLVIVDELQDAGVGERDEVVGNVAGAIPLVRMRRVLPLTAPHDVLRARKFRPDPAAAIAIGEAA